jgi:hypothetical protein
MLCIVIAASVTTTTGGSGPARGSLKAPIIKGATSNPTTTGAVATTAALPAPKAVSRIAVRGASIPSSIGSSNSGNNNNHSIAGVNGNHQSLLRPTTPSRARPTLSTLVHRNQPLIAASPAPATPIANLSATFAGVSQSPLTRVSRSYNFGPSFISCHRACVIGSGTINTLSITINQ